MSKTRHRQGLSRREQKAKHKTQLKHAKTIPRSGALASTPITLGHSIHQDNQFFADCYRFWQSLSLPQKITVFITAVAVGSVFATAFYCLLTREDSAGSHTYQHMMIPHQAISAGNHTNLSGSTISHTAQTIHPIGDTAITQTSTSDQYSHRQITSWREKIYALARLDDVGLPTAAAESTIKHTTTNIHASSSEAILDTLKRIEQDVTKMLTGILGQTQGPAAPEIFRIMTKAIREMRQACNSQSDMQHVSERLQALEQFRRNYNLGIYVLRSFIGEFHLQTSTSLTNDNPFKVMLDRFIANYNPQTMLASFCYDAADKHYLESLNEHRQQLFGELLDYPTFLNYLMRHPQDGYLFDQAFINEFSYQRMLRSDLSRDELLTFLKSPIFTSKVNIIDFFKSIKAIDLTGNRQKSLVFYEYLEWYYVNNLINKTEARALMRTVIQEDHKILSLKHHFEQIFLLQDRAAPEKSKYDLIESVKYHDLKHMSKEEIFTMKIANAYKQLSRCRHNAYYAGMFYAPKFWQYLINPLGGKSVPPELVLVMLTGGTPFHLEDNETTRRATTQLFNYLGLYEDLMLPIYDGHTDTPLLSFTYREFLQHAARQQGLCYFEVPAFRHLHYWSHYRDLKYLSLAAFCEWLTPWLEKIKGAKLSDVAIDNIIRDGVNAYGTTYYLVCSSLYASAAFLASITIYRLYRYINPCLTRQTSSATASSSSRPQSPDSSEKTPQLRLKKHRGPEKYKSVSIPLTPHNTALSGSAPIISIPAGSPPRSEIEITIDPASNQRFNGLIEWHQRQITRANQLQSQLKALEPQLHDWHKPTIQGYLKTLHKITKNKAPQLQQEQNTHYLNAQQSLLAGHKAQLQNIAGYIQRLNSLLNESNIYQTDNSSMPTETLPSTGASHAEPEISTSSQPSTSSGNMALISDSDSDSDDWPPLHGALPAPIKTGAPISLFLTGSSIWGPPPSGSQISTHGATMSARKA